ncbi:hypothetical protein [Enhygromyxa salina]|uniref:Endo-1,4-beta-xylanase A n=1 Tax=Enhygromyxa salina TaxID=215803 RepID=A0A2S9YSW9_9BACT|nr:hypothetical protein [Enhygromyxa salina]PRQ08215.1 hypothetical protein ENSA7_21870 [Enhygromyxa salina]
MRSPILTFSCSLLLIAGGCVDDTPDDGDVGFGTDGDGDGDGDSGDGDGDSGDGDGDGDSGDGDGDPGDGDGDSGDGDGDPGCSYPLGAVEPMAIDEVITPYSWPTAIHGDGTMAALALLDAPCDTDEIVDWSPHELLVFISIPAW